MAFLLSLAYQSALLASLVKSREARVANTFADILEMGLRVNVMEGTALMRYKKNSKMASPKQSTRKRNVSSLLQTHPNSDTREAFRRLGHQYQPNQFHTVAREIGSGEQKGVLGMVANMNKRHILRKGSQLDVGSFRCGYLYGINHPMLQENTSERCLLYLYLSLLSKRYFPFQNHPVPSAEWGSPAH